MTIELAATQEAEIATLVELEVRRVACLEVDAGRGDVLLRCAAVSVYQSGTGTLPSNRGRNAENA